MSNSEGFILPVVIILILVLSLMSLNLFEAEAKHLAILAMVKQEMNR